MKTTMNDLARDYNKLIEAQNIRSEKIAKLEKSIADLEEKAKKFAIEENLKQFQSVKNEMEYLNYQLEALKTKQENEKECLLPVEKVKEAWKDYESQRAKNVTKLKEELEATKIKLKELMSEMVKYESEGISTRNKCGEYIGLKPARNIYDHERLAALASKFPMKYNELPNYEFRYLEDSGVIKRDANQMYYRSLLFVQHFPAPVTV